MANKILLQRKYSKVIEEIAKRAKVPLIKALDMFYNSGTYDDMRYQIAETHCRSDIYLADNVINEKSLKV